VTIDGSANASAKAAPALGDAVPNAKNAAAQDLKDAALAQGTNDASFTQAGKPAAPTPGTKTPATKPTAAANGGAATVANTTDPTSAANATDGQPGQPGNVAPQGQARADSDTVVLAQNGGSGATRANASSDAGSASNAQSGANTSKAVTDGLPNFGVAAAGQTAPSATTAAASSPAAAAAVPIAGLPVVIAARAQAGSNQFDIRLDPPELGRIDVRLDVDSNGQVTSHVIVDRADTLQLLQSQQPQLQHALEQAGLKTADNGLQFSLRDQSFAGQNGQNGAAGNQSGAARLVIPDADQPAIQTTQIYSRVGRLSGIDIRV
jgi:flagellar hook-length control protein FliK